MQNLEPFALLGLLANYNKFEFQNPYRTRLDDFVNDAIIKKIVLSAGATCAMAKDKYVEIQDDLPEAWSIGSTLAFVGLGALAPGRKPVVPQLTPEEAKARFTALSVIIVTCNMRQSANSSTRPGPEAAILLSTYDFANANKLFCFNLVTIPAETRSESSPISSFLSLMSYLFQHSHRSSRCTYYSYLMLYTIEILIEDQVLAKRICSDESKTTVRLCRQRQPFLPLARGDRVLAAVIIDIMVDGINHNVKKRLDVDYYLYDKSALALYFPANITRLCLGILLRLVSFLGRSRIRLSKLVLF
jgi:hypothetical protein